MANEPIKTYEDGLRDGRLERLVGQMDDHQGRLNNHSQRLSRIEKVMYGLIGVVAFINIWPVIKVTLLKSF